MTIGHITQEQKSTRQAQQRKLRREEAVGKEKEN